MTKTLYKVIGFCKTDYGFFNQFSCFYSIGEACATYNSYLYDPEMDGAVMIRCQHETWEVIQEFNSESYPYSVECGPLFTHRVIKSPDLVLV